MTFAVTIVDASHRPNVFAEIELDGELIAEAYVEAGRMRLAFVDPSGGFLGEGSADEFGDAVTRARAALADAGLLG